MMMRIKQLFVASSHDYDAEIKDSTPYGLEITCKKTLVVIQHYYRGSSIEVC